MSKELPYWRFTSSEWLNGDISLEGYEVKGLFIDLCAYYWFRDCSITQAMLYKRFSNAEASINKLFESGIIKKNEKDDFITIEFLNEQFDELSELRKHRQIAGSKGGKQRSSNAKAKLKQKSSYKDNNKDKDKDEDKDKVDYDFIVKNYHELCPRMNKVAVINDQRKGYMNARVGEFGLDKVISVFRLAGESDFLNGINDKVWKADFEWILRPTNFVKILEGKYKKNVIVPEFKSGGDGNR